VWIVVAVLLAVFVLPDQWDVPVVALGVMIEVVETFVWIRLLGRVPVATGPDTLIGADARVTRACNPIGEVQVRGEAWRARCQPGADAGQRVRVRAREGITLVVEPAEP
jgi:membrane protein implicated in regulation of membrane protease activity